MTFNLFIACENELDHGQRKLLRANLSELGDWFQLQRRLFYLRTSLSPIAIHRRLESILPTSAIAVIHYTLTSEHVMGWRHPPLDTIHTIWTQIRDRAESYAMPHSAIPMAYA